SRASTGVHELSLLTTYEDKYHVKRTDTISTGVDVKGIPEVDITKTETSPEEIKGGESYAKLKLKIDNVGTDDAKYLKLSLNVTDPFGFSKAYHQVYETGLLGAGSSSEAVFYLDVDIDARAGAYDIPVKIEYQDTRGEKYEKTEKIEITIKEKPNFEIVSVKTSPDVTTQGSTVELRIAIRNTGNEEAESVSLRAMGVAEQPFDFDVKSDFIGNLKPDETGEAVLKLSVKDDTPLKIYHLDTEIRCVGDKDIGDENVYTFDRTVSLNVSKTGGLEIPGFEAVFAVASLTVACFVLRKRKWA
ncbi:MAG: PGF-CTERM sorting domain-containing protein, partial [Methanocellales archaeon]|nr:PGF-CTERM sorting domain-containing protein [Methanocellales archaeon]MDD3291771.1 PGF-CTERM sorting domain-containing protein [Methanocellales archaeon]MDD5235121.1 PGF-CTERM sorting domain-containing protein [Methanocellales archaeon]MDD5485259.1 PGF-CTERM sorting domain-containing protein [Methanocellales archaeon]